jgi:chromosomal replication initiator protein
VTATRNAELPTRIRSLLNERLGERRASVWFDGEARLDVREGRLRIESRSSFVSDWIQRHFRSDLQAAAREALGSDELHWEVVEKAPATSAGMRAAPPAEHGRTGARERRSDTDRGPAPRGLASAWRRLDDFVPGTSNRLALDAAQRLGTGSDSVRCMVVHGGCGVGKTHLLQGICRARRERHPQARVRYVPAEQFTNEYIQAVRNGQLDAFRARMRRVDLLAIDDVHFLADKAATQSEFLHTLDALDLAGAQIALASDAHPRLIRKFAQTLVSRMLAGIVVQVESPDPITRGALADRLALRRALPLGPEAREAIAARCVGGAREIEGLLTRVDALRALSGTSGPVGAGEIQAILQQDDARRGTQPVRLPEVIDVVCTRLGVESDQLRANGRHRRVTLARGLVGWLARDLTAMSFPEIARGLGRGAHSAVHGACARVQTLLDADARVDAGAAGEMQVRELVAQLRHALRAPGRA